MNKCKVSASQRNSRTQLLFETKPNGITPSFPEEDVQISTIYISNGLEGTWLYFKLCKWALMGSSYRLVNGVLWCISRKPRVLPNRNFTDWIYTNVFESGKTDAFANQLSAIGSTNSGIVYEALGFSLKDSDIHSCLKRSRRVVKR